MQLNGHIIKTTHTLTGISYAVTAHFGDGEMLCACGSSLDEATANLKTTIQKSYALYHKRRAKLHKLLPLYNKLHALLGA